MIRLTERFTCEPATRGWRLHDTVTKYVEPRTVKGVFHEGGIRPVTDTTYPASLRLAVNIAIDRTLGDKAPDDGEVVQMQELLTRLEEVKAELAASIDAWGKGARGPVVEEDRGYPQYSDGPDFL